jgi:ketosteroid isomerase-like protein
MDNPSVHKAPSPNVRLIWSLLEGWNRGEPGEELLHADLEADITRWAFDVPKVWRGREELDPRVSSLMGVWEGLRCEVRDVVESGDRLVALVHIGMRGRASGVRLSDLRDGKIAQLVLYPEQAEALDALAADRPG